MRIAFVLDRYRPKKGGLESWISALTDHLRGKEHELHFVSGDRAIADDRFRFHPIRTRGLTRAGRDRDFADRARMLSAAEAFDVVLGFRHLLTCDVYAPHGGCVADAFRAHREAGFLRGLPSARLRNFLRLERELLTGPEPPRAILAVSNLVRDDLVRRYPAVTSRITVVPNGVELARFTPKGREAAREDLGVTGPAALFVASNPRLKGWRFVARAFSELRRRGALEHLLVAGGNPGRLPSGAVWLGSLGDPRPAYRCADVLLQPTYYDPFPLTTLESLACGTPVVTTERNGALGHLAASGAVRAAKDPRDVGGIVRATRELLGEAPRDAARALAEGFPIAKSLAATERLLLAKEG